MKKKIPDTFYSKHYEEIREKIFELSKSLRCRDNESKQKLKIYIDYLYEKDEKKGEI